MTYIQRSHSNTQYLSISAGMRVYHHKTNKPLFQGSLALSLAFHVALIVYVSIWVV